MPSSHSWDDILVEGLNYISKWKKRTGKILSDPSYIYYNGKREMEGMNSSKLEIT